jgi:superfamily II DNA/RNA helicase
MRKLRALVILPTQDLALQIKETFDQFLHGTRLKVDLLTGNKRSDAHRDMHNDHEARCAAFHVLSANKIDERIAHTTSSLQHQAG